MKSIAIEERKLVQELRGNNINEKSDTYIKARTKLIETELKYQNKENGYWVACINSEAAHNSISSIINFNQNDKITITVSDTGCGISEEDLPHVKEKFYKTNMTVHGSGIGLAVVDEIIRMHKGTFEIDSVLGQGTTVTISFDIDHVEIEELWDINEAISQENENKSTEDIE